MNAKLLQEFKEGKVVIDYREVKNLDRLREITGLTEYILRKGVFNFYTFQGGYVCKPFFLLFHRIVTVDDFYTEEESNVASEEELFAEVYDLYVFHNQSEDAIREAASKFYISRKPILTISIAEAEALLKEVGKEVKIKA